MTRAAASRTLPPAVSWLLPRDPSSGRQARRLTTSALVTWGFDPDAEAADDLRLCVSEAVANAVCHGAGSIELILTSTGDAVVSEIRDQGTWHAPAVGGDGEHGRGLKIIASIAHGMALTKGEDGTVIRFLIPLPVMSAGMVA